MNTNKNSMLPAFAAITDNYIQEGLTKREYFAGLAMQGILMNREAQFATLDIHFDNICQDAVKIADRLLKELEQ
jgi:hypothetical protein